VAAAELSSSSVAEPEALAMASLALALAAEAAEEAELEPASSVAEEEISEMEDSRAEEMEEALSVTLEAPSEASSATELVAPTNCEDCSAAALFCSSITEETDSAMLEASWVGAGMPPSGASVGWGSWAITVVAPRPRARRQAAENFIVASWWVG
jgi:hypothetical protein